MAIAPFWFSKFDDIAFDTVQLEQQEFIRFIWRNYVNSHMVCSHCSFTKHTALSAIREAMKVNIAVLQELWGRKSTKSGWNMPMFHYECINQDNMHQEWMLAVHFVDHFAKLQTNSMPDKLCPDVWRKEVSDIPF